MATKKRKWLKVLIILISVIAVIAVAVIIFINAWPAFGAKASQEDKLNYSLRAENFNGTVFQNEGEFHVMNPVQKGMDDGFLSEKGTIPEALLQAVSTSFLSEPGLDDLTITWFGHSTLLIQMHGMNILFDPVFSQVASPVSFISMGKRFNEMPCGIEELPDIDIVIITHDHYDHLDYQSIVALDAKVKQYIVPLGVENHLERWNVAPDKITNMAWWEETNVNGLTIACTPAKHYSGRSINDRYASLWASFVLKDEFNQIYQSGDTGYGNHFQEIHDRYGDFDFVMVDCAQYSTRWTDVHMTPEEAFKAIQTLGAKNAMPIHWASFRLSSHPWDDSAVRLVSAATNSGIAIETPNLGETMSFGNLSDYQKRWYEKIK